jgi:hypothetical protein
MHVEVKETVEKTQPGADEQDHRSREEHLLAGRL